MRPVDLVHLARYTGGDRTIDTEVLTLFTGQAEQLIARLRIQLDRADAQGWHETTHALKGAAGCIGAFALADAAAAAEVLDPASQGEEAGRAVDGLRSLITRVKLFLHSHFKN
ncbi:MAG TPA: Hpt domain-containing protein [Rhizomicrobium sp.]